MKVRAVALGDERSNAIGTVELECTPFALVIAYLGVGSFSEGYAPGALTRGTLVSVPYSEIKLARFEGERLYLELRSDKTPHDKLVLGGFSVSDGTHRHELYRGRLVLRSAAFGFALIAALLAAVIATRIAPESSAAAAISIAVVVAATVLAVGFFIDRKLVSGQLEGEAAQNALAHELRMHIPQLLRLDRAPVKPPKAVPLPDFQGLLPRTMAAIVITMTAGGLAAVLVAHWMLRSPEAARAQLDATRLEEENPIRPPTSPGVLDLDSPANPEPGPPLAPAGSPPAKPAVVASSRPSETKNGSAARSGQCTCERASSALWQEAVPKLSILVLSTRLHQKGRRKHLELDIAVVNNSDKELEDITLRVNFYERDPAPSNRRHFSKHRVLFFEGPLYPGRAIKWSTEARGVEFELENPVEGDIGPGGDSAAPADAFAELLNANHRPVRLHGAMMLTYLGDPRAREAVLKLRDALREEEASYLRRLLAALGELRTCEVRVSGSGGKRSVSACVFNASDEKQDNLVLKVNALEGPVSLAHPVGAPPTILGDGVFGLPGSLASQTGARFEANLDLAEAKATSAKAFEVLVGHAGEAL